MLLNVGSLAIPVGGAGAAAKALAGAKVGALVERFIEVGSKIGGPAGEAFSGGVRGGANGIGDALKVLEAARQAPAALAREMAAAVKPHLPVLHPSIAGVGDGVTHMTGDGGAGTTPGVGHTGGSGGASGAHGTSPSDGYDPRNYNSDGTIKEGKYGKLSPERRQELLDQQTTHDAQAEQQIVNSGQKDPEGWEAGGSDGSNLHLADGGMAPTLGSAPWQHDGGVIDTAPYSVADHLTIPVGFTDLRYVDFKTRPGEAVFWSGKTDGIGGDGVAAAIASSHGGSTLEQFLLDHQVSMPAFDPNVQNSIDTWERVSRSLAESASGDVHAILGSKMRPGNIWESIEFPALKANPDVTRVFAVDPKSGVVSLIWERPEK